MSKQELAKLPMDELSKKLQEKEITVAEFTAAVNAQQDAERLKGNVGIANIKVGDKKGLVVRLRSQGKAPTTLYAFQWVQLLSNVDQIVDALYANRGELAFKDGQSLPDRDELVATIVGKLQTAEAEAA